MEIINSQFANSLLSVMKFNPRGEYSETEEYHFFDLVSNNGSSYCAVTTSTGQSLLDTDYWQLVSSKGEQGIQGEPGNYTGCANALITTTEENTTQIITDVSPITHEIECIVTGNTVQQSEWVHKTGLSSQASYVGKNLHGGASLLIGKLITNASTGEIITSSGYNTLYLPVVDGQIISTQGYTNSAGVSLGYVIYDASGTRITSGGHEVNITMPSGAGYFARSVATDKNNLAQTEFSPTATAYEPYCGGIPSPNPSYPQPLVSNLPAGTYKTKDWKGDWYEFTLTEDLCGVNGVSDSIEFDRIGHNGYLRKKNLKSVFDGSVDEQWSLQGTNATGIIGFIIIVESSRESVTKAVDALCSHLPYSAIGLSATTTQLFFVQRGIGSTNLYIRMWQSDVADLAAFKTWLSDNNITVVNTMKTAIRTPLTFTLDNASTAPECPMEFLTNVPSLEYPAGVYDASGTVKVRGKNLWDGGMPGKWLRIGGALDSVSTAVCTDKILCAVGDTLTLSSASEFQVTPGNAGCIGFYNVSDGIVGRTAATSGTKLTATAPANTAYARASAYAPTVTSKMLLEFGSVATPYGPYRPEVTASIPALRSVNEVRDTFNPRTGVKVKNNSDWVDFRNKSWSLFNSYTGYKGVVSYQQNQTVGTNTGRVFKYTSVELLPTTTLSGFIDGFRFSDYKYPVIFMSNADSGWSDTYSPTNDEVKAYFYGWKMCHSDGSTPYTSGTKHWKRLMGTDAEIQASITPTLPTASYDGFTPYKMIYQLAEPIEEQVEETVFNSYYPTTVIKSISDNVADLNNIVTYNRDIIKAFLSLQDQINILTAAIAVLS